MYFVPPALLPKKGKGVLLLDEFPQAPPAVQAVAYQLVLDRRLGEYTLPDGWSIVAAGEPCQRRRCALLLARSPGEPVHPPEPDCEPPGLGRVGSQNGISDLTRAYLRFRPDQLLDMGARKTGMAYPSPQLGDGGYRDPAAARRSRGAGDAHRHGWRRAWPRNTWRSSRSPVSCPPRPDHPGPGQGPVAEVPWCEARRRAHDGTRGHAVESERVLGHIERLEVEYQVVFAQGLARDMKLNQQKPFVDWAVKNAKVMGLE